MIYILGLIGVLIGVALDQFTKYLAVAHIKEDPIILIDGVLEFRYLENSGAAFGMMENMQWIFILFALLISAAALWLYFHIPMERKFIPMQIICITLTAGAVGNMIDRIFRGFVVDMIDVTCINFYVFNVADSAVCIGCGLLILYMILDEIRTKREKAER